MVAKAWGSLPEEMIRKSFLQCGQLKDGSPEEITCMKEGRSAHPALEEVKKFWNHPPEKFGDDPYEAIEEIDEEEDPLLIDDDDDDNE